MEDPNNKTILMLKATKSIKRPQNLLETLRLVKILPLHPQTMGEDFKTLDN